MDKPCIKKQKERPYKYSNFAWCSCGHNSVDHGWWGFFLGRFTRSKCDDCTCSKFDYIGQYTYGNIDDVPLCDDNDNN